MNKSTKISLVFFLIFLLGILGVFTFVNKALNKKSFIKVPIKTEEIAFVD
tara:strand:+ start:404 stop:553 length:150 start_codon:yes stop_codon:yes gene_type:complete